MRVRAVAAPSPESNAIGPIELECTNQGLHITYLGVGAFKAGFAPAAVTTGTHVLVPWTDVTEVRLQRDHVFVGIEPRITPHCRLALVHFSEGTEAAPLERQRRQRWFRLTGAAASVLVGLLVALQLPRWFASMGGVAGVAWGLVVALLTFVGYLAAERLWFPEPRAESDVQREFIDMVRLFKPVAVGARSGAPTEPAPLDWNQVIAQLPRSTLAIAITLTATGIAFVLTAARFAPREAREDRPRTPAPSELAARAPVVEPAAAVADVAVSPDEAREAPVDPSPEVTAAPPVASLGACECKRADSVLWRDGFPRLSTLLISSANRSHNDHSHLELELGVVNNSNESLPEVNLMVQFFEDEGKRPMKERPLHYSGPLRPGQAVKWHVEARGTSFVVHNPIREVLSAPGAYAPASEFAALLKANHRPVRLHGAMMLAFLGDQRAKGGAVKLQEALRESEQPYLERVLMTQNEIITCDWRASTEGQIRQVSACAYNQSTTPQTQLAARVRGLDRPFDHRNPVASPPQVIVEQTWNLPGELSPRTGQLVQFSLDINNPEGKIPVGFEFLVDRADRLP